MTRERDLMMWTDRNSRSTLLHHGVCRTRLSQELRLDFGLQSRLHQRNSPNGKGRWYTTEFVSQHCQLKHLEQLLMILPCSLRRPLRSSILQILPELGRCFSFHELLLHLQPHALALCQLLLQSKEASILLCSTSPKG